MLRRTLSGAVAVAYALIASGCATLIHGTHQDLRLGLQPTGTEVAVYRWSGESVSDAAGVSPGTLRVHRPRWHEPYLVRGRSSDTARGTGTPPRRRRRGRGRTCG